jgi:hypothetical protein
LEIRKDHTGCIHKPTRFFFLANIYKEEKKNVFGNFKATINVIFLSLAKSVKDNKITKETTSNSF